MIILIKDKCQIQTLISALAVVVGVDMGGGGVLVSRGWKEYIDAVHWNPCPLHTYFRLMLCGILPD